MKNRDFHKLLSKPHINMRGQSVLVKSIAGPTNTDLWYKLDLIRLKIRICLQI